MQSLSGRRRARQGRVRRRSPQRTVDPDALKSFWSSLTLGKKLQVLHFEDRTLVERAYVVQHMLWYSELMCVKSGVHISDGAGKGVNTLAMDAFEFKWMVKAPAWMGVAFPFMPSEEGEKMPSAFAARLGFVECGDFPERLERYLGCSLLDGLPDLRREEWASVFEPTANSWAEYERQVWNLVRYALIQAYEDAAAATAEEVAAAAELEKAALPGEVAAPEVAAELSDLDLDDAVGTPAAGTCSKRRARKKCQLKQRQALALAAGQTGGASVVEEEARPSQLAADQEAGPKEADEEEEALEDGADEAAEETEEEDEEDEDEEEEQEEESDQHDQEAEEEVTDAPSEAGEAADADQQDPAPLLEDESFSTWEAVLTPAQRRKRDRQRQQLATPVVAVEASSSGLGSNGRGAAPASSTDQAGGTGHAGSAVEVAAAVAADPEPVSSRPVAVPRTDRSGAIASLRPLPCTWRLGGMSEITRWHMVAQATESIRFMASVKRTFLDVEAVFPSEPAPRRRARSHSPVICMC